MSEPTIRFVRANPGDAPPDGERLADALAALLIGARRRECKEDGDGGEIQNTNRELEAAK